MTADLRYPRGDAVALRALGWDHPRCMLPMRACAEAWRRSTGIVVEWHARSLEAFGDQPLEEVANDYDLLVIDHPLCGTASRTGCLAAIDQLIEGEPLSEIIAGTIGPSGRSYIYDKHVWALASDAACQVTAIARELEHRSPDSWDGALALVGELGHRSAIPLTPAHAICSLLTLWAAAGLDPGQDPESLVNPERGIEQLEWLCQAAAHGHPAATGWEPPAALAALAAGELDYVPLAYGYVNYAGRREDGRASRCRFVDIPGVTGAVLGGAGLAVSAGSAHPDLAAAFALWACGPEAQHRVVTPAGGQPADRSCWSDPEIDDRADGFYSSTLATMEGAWVRPRAEWWPRFQRAAGQALTAGLGSKRRPAELMTQLLRIYRQTTVRIEDVSSCG